MRSGAAGGSFLRRARLTPPDHASRLDLTGVGLEEGEMSDSANERLMLLKGFSFDGDTGRTMADLYRAVEGIGFTRDAPFVKPLWLEGDDRPAGVNSFLDPEGKRVHVVWRSDDSGLSTVVDVVLDAPSLAREPSGESCDICSIDMMSQLSQQALDSEDA